MSGGRAAVVRLRRFVAGPVERCDFCRVRLPAEHDHLVETASLRLFCACAPCAEETVARDAGFRRVEPHQEALADFALADTDWASLDIPIEVAFLFRPEADAAPIALFPGPGGATRSQLSRQAWAHLAGKYPLLDALEPGAEALLVNRTGGRRDHYRVSTDHCYALAGLMRARWRGLTGGEEAWSAIDGYFAELDASAKRGAPPMPELDFHITGVETERYAIAPTLLFGLKIASRGGSVRNIALRSQIRIEPLRRGYDETDHERLVELFGEKRRWSQTLRSFLWDHVNLPVPAFEHEIEVKLPVACSHDFNVAATKYFHGLEGGEAPLSFLFSGAVFYDDAEDRLQISQIAWNKEASFGLPIAVWQALMAQYYPDSTWLRVRHDLFDRLQRYKRERGFADLDRALESLIPDPGLEGAS